MSMTKTQAIALFGGTQDDLAKALGITQSRVSRIPDPLKLRDRDRIAGAALRLGVIKGWADLHRKLAR